MIQFGDNTQGKLHGMSNKQETHNKSLHWIFTPLHFVKTSEFKR